MTGLQEILLIRHAQSQSNIGEKIPHREGEHSIELTTAGQRQAQALVNAVSSEALQTALVYCSPFLRARQTLRALLNAHCLGELPVREDPLLREQDRGYLPEKEQLTLRKLHGWFWYRHAGGESPADVHQRMSLFLTNLYRHAQKADTSRAIIVSHGMTIRCFVMRYLNLRVEDFNRMKNPPNGAVIRIAPLDAISDPVFANARWAVSGLSLRRVVS